MSPLRRATREDNARLLELFGSVPMQGQLVLATQRSPDFFRLYDIQRGGTELWVCCARLGCRRDHHGQGYHFFSLYMDHDDPHAPGAPASRWRWPEPVPAQPQLHDESCRTMTSFGYAQWKPARS